MSSFFFRFIFMMISHRIITAKTLIISIWNHAVTPITPILLFFINFFYHFRMIYNIYLKSINTIFLNGLIYYYNYYNSWMSEMFFHSNIDSPDCLFNINFSISLIRHFVNNHGTTYKISERIPKIACAFSSIILHLLPLFSVLDSIGRLNANPHVYIIFYLCILVNQQTNTLHMRIFVQTH